ncbi:MAG: hypothetical protein MMC33_007747 [Icmadophila ericetorum]|nr:hypothetical protein [Icmadophila ericetorum]
MAGFLGLFLLYLPAAILIYLTSLVVYRRLLHPLSKIPGPSWAAITYLYSFNYNVIGPGSRFYLQIEKLHKQYGPVVRIGPNEIHLSDPENYEKIYYVGSKFGKDPIFYGGLGLSASAFGTPSNELHRVRRAALQPLFTRKQVLDLEDVVQSKVGLLLQRIDEDLKQGKPVDLHHGFRAISVDVVTDYAFGKCYDLLKSPDLGSWFCSMIRDLAPRIWILQQFPFVLPLSKSIPPALAKRMSANLAAFLVVKDNCEDEIRKIKKRVEAQEKMPARKTIFHQLLSPNATDGHVVPSVDDLIDEAFTFIGAATDTTGGALAVATYHAVSNAAIYQSLVAELKKAFPNPNAKLDFQTLERLPYLVFNPSLGESITAVIKEGLRLSFGVPGRLPRVTPEGGAVFNGYSVPEGTVVGMSSWMMHRDPSIFPSPESFDPDRWTNPATAGKLEKYLVAFGKGGRQCLGMTLAYSELYITLGTIFRHFENLKACEMSSEDWEFDDFFGLYIPESARKFHVEAA